MPVLIQEDEEFGFQVDQSEEESSEEETEDDSEDGDDESEEETTDDDEETEESSEAESGDETTEDDEDSDDEEDEDSDEKETTDDDGDEDESEEGDDDDEDETFEDEEGLVSGEKKAVPDEDAKRQKAIGATVICILLLALILGLGLGLGLKDDGDDATPAPTPAPTVPPTAAAPVAPSVAPTGVNGTLAPTMAPVEGLVMIAAEFDTTIYVDGQNEGGNFGTEDTMLVQGGDPGDNDLPRAYSLVQFPLNSTELGMLMEPVESEFCLTHVINEGTGATYSTCAVPYTSDVADLTGSMVPYNIPAECLFGEILTFDIEPTSETVCINVTQLVASLASSGGDGNETTARLRGRWRQLQDGPLLQDEPMLQDSLTLPDGPLVMAVYLGGDSSETGDRFYTSNDAEGRGPELNLVSLAEPQTMSPSSNMTSGPNEPCNICGGDLSITLPNAIIPTGEEPDDLTCATAQLACDAGLCNFTQCDTLVQVVGTICGCEVVDPTIPPDGTDSPTTPDPVNDPCNICGDGLNVTIPEGTIPGSDGLTCDIVAQACLGGACNATECESLVLIAQETCGCSAGDIEV